LSKIRGSLIEEIEEWRDIPGYEGYQASNLGWVRGCRNNRGELTDEWRVMKPTIRKSNGYRIQTLKRDGDRKPVQKHLHQWITLAFHGPPGPRQQVRHLDGDKTHNYLSNLRYGTAQENALDKIEHGTQQRGEGHPSSKLTERDVEVIHDAISRQIPQNMIAAVFGIYPTVISKIKRGELWEWSHPNHQESDAA